MDGHTLGMKQWPPNRTHSRSTSLTSIPSPLRIIHGPEPTDTPIPSPPVTPVRKLFKNGYEVTPKGLYSPSYALNSPGARNQVPLERADATPLAPQKALDPYEWTDIAVQNNLIPLGGRLHSFQIAAANLVLMQHGDGVIISPTGSGKSLTWVLPLLARQEGISLIITPYTSLGLEGELL